MTIYEFDLYALQGMYLHTIYVLCSLRRRAVSRYVFAGKRFCDLDLCTHDLENLTSQ